VVPAIGPEEFREAQDLGGDGGVRTLGMGGDFFEQPFLPQAILRELAVNDGIDGDGGLLQPVGQLLLLGREPLEALGLKLNECRGIHSINQGALAWSGFILLCETTGLECQEQGCSKQETGLQIQPSKEGKMMLLNV
jgi:hypothetical protein